MTRIAVVIDTSGSMKDLIGVFSLNQRLRKIRLKSFVGCKTQKLVQLANEYDQVYLFTDGLIDIDWNLILNNKVIVVKVEL